MIDGLVKRPNGTGSKAYQRADGRWVAKLTLGRRHGRQWQRGYYSRTSAEDAEKKRDEARRRLGIGQDLDDPNLPLRDYLADWLRRQEVKGLATSTLRRYRQIVANQLEPMLGSVAVGSLTPERIEGMLEELAASALADRTVFHARDVLRNALKRAVRKHVLLRNPATDAEMPVREPGDEQRSLTPSEAIDLVRGLGGHRWHAAIIVAMTTGMREGEVLRLRWPDVDEETRGLRVPGTKTKDSRMPIALPETAAVALRAWRRQQAAERLQAGAEWKDRHELVFTRPDGRPASARSVLDDLQRAARQAGLGHLTFHQLRHTAGSLLQAEGVDLKTIQRVLRHSTISTTADRYVHVVDAALVDAADRMDHLFARAGQLLPPEPGEPVALIDLPRPDVAALRARYVRRGRQPQLDREVLGVLDEIAACNCTGPDVDAGRRWSAAIIAGTRRGANTIGILVATHQVLHADATAGATPAPLDADAVDGIRSQVMRGLRELAAAGDLDPAVRIEAEAREG